MKPANEYSKLVRYNKITSILIAVHTWRIGGIAFLLAMTQGRLDPALAIPAGVGDILIGVTAIPLAIFLWKGYSWSKYAVIVWSVLGIADLVNAVTLGIITNPDLSTSTTGTWILSNLIGRPVSLIFVPTVAVPTAIFLHVIVLYRLRNWEPIQAHRKSLEA